MTGNLTFAQAIRDALFQAFELDPRVICFGLGVTDPKGIFGTTLGLEDRFGSRRVFDVPTSENALTGIGVGAALRGYRPVMVHQRLDFFLLAMDQLVNNAAKWFYMFGGQSPVPITIRLILGRGWGQGPTHSQALHAWFAHVPGLKVVMPTFAEDAKGLLLSSIFDDNPVVFLEHRWLHGIQSAVPAGDMRIPLGKARVMQRGRDITIVSMSYMTVEAMHAIEYLQAAGISCELIDLRTIKPLDWETILGSIGKTGRLLALDIGSETGSVAGEIVARASIECFASLRSAPRRLAMPDCPVPTSPALTEGLYSRSEHITRAVAAMLGVNIDSAPLVTRRTWPHDVPGEWFKGPF